MTSIKKTETSFSRFSPSTIVKIAQEEATNIKRITYPWKSDLKNSLRILLWKPIITDKIAASKKDNCKYLPRVSSGLFQP